MKIEIINFEEYKKIDAKELYPVDNYSRAFGKVLIKNKCYKLAWRSDILKPEISFLKSDYIYIGIDQFFVIYNIETAEIILKLILQWNFLKIIIDIKKNKLHVITEQSILTIIISNLSIVRNEVFPETIEDVKNSEKMLEVYCMNGNKYNLVV